MDVKGSISHDITADVDEVDYVDTADDDTGADYYDIEADAKDDDATNISFTVTTTSNTQIEGRVIYYSTLKVDKNSESNANYEV